MTGRHGHELAGLGANPRRRLAPDTAIVGLVAFVLVVALTPRDRLGAIAIEAVVLVALVLVARVRSSIVLRRLVVITPFLVLAALTPFVAGGPTTRVLGLTVSTEGLWSAWNLASKASMGAAASIVFASTTTPTDFVTGLGRLRVPAVLVGIIGFMFRYLGLLVDQLGRMRMAMVARGHDPRWLGQARPLASSVGTLFVRSYERGERTHRAMLARGFTGRIPDLDDRRASVPEWCVALAPALIGGLVLVSGFGGEG